NNLVRHHRGQLDLAGTAVVLRDRRLHTAFCDYDRFNVQSRHELHIVHREDIGGIDHRQRESCADAGEGQNGMFLRDLLRDETYDVGIDVEEVEIDGWNAVLTRQHGRDHVVA